MGCNYTVELLIAMASKADLEGVFRVADVDHSNSLTLKELCDAMRKLGYKGDDKVLQEFFSKSDISGDGKISFEEYMKAMNNAPASIHRAALMRRMFAKFDKDGNGSLDRKELQNATAMLGDRFDDSETALLMELLDKDKSDTVDMEEFIQSFLNARR